MWGAALRKPLPTCHFMRGFFARHLTQDRETFRENFSAVQNRHLLPQPTIRALKINASDSMETVLTPYRRRIMDKAQQDALKKAAGIEADRKSVV